MLSLQTQTGELFGLDLACLVTGRESCAIFKTELRGRYVFGSLYFKAAKIRQVFGGRIK